jgi:polyhydroxyalkanoate synthesis regulator phasin
MERIVITFTDAGQFRGASVADFNGQPKPLDEAALNALFPAVNASSFSRVTTLEEDLSEMTTANESATTELESATSRVESLESQIADTQTQLETAQGEASSVPNLQAQLDTATSRVESLESQIADTQTQLETAQGEASSVPNLQAQLDTALARIAELEAVPEEPVIVGVSKLTIMRRLGDKWPTLKAALLTLPEIVQDAWLLAQEIRADDELFVAYKDTLQTLLDLTDEEFNALLIP